MQHRLFVFVMPLLAVFSLVLLISCSSKPALQTDIEPPAAEQAQGTDQGLVSIGTPGTLGKELTLTKADRSRDGYRFNKALPNKLAYSIDWPNAHFRLNWWEPDMGARIAYACYPFLLTEYDDEPVISFTWETPPAGDAQYWLGLAEWGRDRWQWFSADAEHQLALPSLAPYIRDDGALLLVMVVMGEELCILSEIQIGTGEHIWHFESLNVEHAGVFTAYWYIVSPDSLVIDEGNNPHLACYAAYVTELDEPPYFEMECNIEYAVRDGAEWQVSVADAGCGEGYSFPVLALDSEQYAHIAYYENTLESEFGAGDASTAIKYLYQDGEAWLAESVETTGHGGQEKTPGLAVDSLGQPHIAFINGHVESPYEGCFRYGQRTAEGWELTSFDYGEYSYYNSINIAIDSDDLPHMSYLSYDAAAMYATYDEFGWHWHILSSEPWRANNSTIALDSEGVPYVCYQNLDDLCLYMKDPPSDPFGEFRIVASDDKADSYKLVIDDTGRIHICFITTDGIVMYATHPGDPSAKGASWNDDGGQLGSGSSWHIERVWNNDNSIPTYAAMAVDSEGKPHVCIPNTLELIYAYRLEAIGD